eukprot:s7517_g2.t1
MGPKAAADALALVQLGAGASTGREGLVKRRRRKCCNAIATYSLHLYVRCPPYRGHQRDPLGRHPVQDKGWRPFFGIQKKKQEKKNKDQPADAAGKKKKQKKEKNEKKDEYILNPKNTACPRILRGLCHIIRTEAKDPITGSTPAFNRLKIIFEPRGGAGTGDIWSYISGVDPDTECHFGSLNKVAKIDGRFPWTFLHAPSFAVVAEWIGRKMSVAVNEGLQQLAFPITTQGTLLADLPEAMATGGLLCRLATKRFRVDHPGAKKARHIPPCIQGPSFASIFLHLPP